MDMALSAPYALEEFRPRVCRLECGHTFHCLCVGEAAMHASIMFDVGLSLECPNCLRVTQARSSWHYPDLPQQQPSQPLGEPAMPAHSGTTGGADSEHFRTPPEHPPSEHAFLGGQLKVTCKLAQEAMIRQAVPLLHTTAACAFLMAGLAS